MIKLMLLASSLTWFDLPPMVRKDVRAEIRCEALIEVIEAEYETADDEYKTAYEFCDKEETAACEKAQIDHCELEY